MYYKSNNTLKRLTISREAIEIVQSDTYLGEVMTRFGYGAEELATGLNVQGVADVLYSRRDIEYGNQRVATENLQVQYKAVRNQLRNDRLIVGTVVGTSSGQARLLRLSLPIGRTYEALLTQALHFYRELQANEALNVQLAGYSFTDDVLLARIEGANALSAAMKKQQVQVGEAQVITAQFREAMAELDGWMSQFIGVARQAFRDDPKQLKKLGIYVRTSKKAVSESDDSGASATAVAPSE